MIFSPFARWKKPCPCFPGDRRPGLGEVVPSGVGAGRRGAPGTVTRVPPRVRPNTSAGATVVSKGCKWHLCLRLQTFSRIQTRKHGQRSELCAGSVRLAGAAFGVDIKELSHWMSPWSPQSSWLRRWGVCGTAHPWGGGSSFAWTSGSLNYWNVL